MIEAYLATPTEQDGQLLYVTLSRPQRPLRLPMAGGLSSFEALVGLRGEPNKLLGEDDVIHRVFRRHGIEAAI